MLALSYAHPSSSSKSFLCVLNSLPKPLAHHGLQAVLMIGNTLNGSTFRGGAQGFQLDALLKVDFIDSGIEGSSYPYVVERNEDS